MTHRCPHTRALFTSVDWLRCQQVGLVATEATSDYWEPVFYLLDAPGGHLWCSAPSTPQRG